MKKWLVIIAVLLLLILVVVPGGMGLIAEKRIKTLTATWPTNSPFLVKILSYQRGWFTSNMQLDVTLTGANHNPPIHVYLNEKIQHGPVLFNKTNHFFGIGQAYATGDVVVPVDQQALFKQYLDQTTLFNNTLFLHLFGGTSIGLNAPELAILDPQSPNNRITIEGLSIMAKLSPGMSHIKSHSSLQSLNWQDSSSNVMVSNIAGHSDLSKTAQGLWLGDMNISVAAADFNQGGKVLGSIKNAQYASSSKEKDGLINGTNHISLDSLMLRDVSYGPAEVSLNLQNVNAEPLAQLKRLTRAMQMQGSPVMQQAMAPHMQKLIFKIISRGMQLTINPISVQTPNGEISGQINLSMPNLLQTPEGKMIPHPQISITTLIGGAQGSLQFTVPKAILLTSLQNSILSNMQAMTQMLSMDSANSKALLAAAQQRAAAQLQGWVAAGILIESAGNYQFSAAYQQGKLLVNGKPLFNPAFGAAAANNMPAITGNPANAAVPAQPAAPTTMNVQTGESMSAAPVAPTDGMPAPVTPATVAPMPAPGATPEQPATTTAMPVISPVGPNPAAPVPVQPTAPAANANMAPAVSQ